MKFINFRHAIKFVLVSGFKFVQGIIKPSINKLILAPLDSSFSKLNLVIEIRNCSRRKELCVISCPGDWHTWVVGSFVVQG